MCKVDPQCSQFRIQNPISDIGISAWSVKRKVLERHENIILDFFY